MDRKLRLRFSKTGKAKYISHLDLMATMCRALLRSGIKLKYSEGYNPHPYMSFALPLSVGDASMCELLDFGITDELSPEDLPAVISAALPEGLEILEAYTPQRKFSGIAWVALAGEMHYDVTPPGVAERLMERLNSNSIMIAKKTKGGRPPFLL